MQVIDAAKGIYYTDLVKTLANIGAMRHWGALLQGIRLLEDTMVGPVMCVLHARSLQEPPLQIQSESDSREQQPCYSISHKKPCYCHGAEQETV